MTCYNNGTLNLSDCTCQCGSLFTGSYCEICKFHHNSRDPDNASLVSTGVHCCSKMPEEERSTRLWKRNIQEGKLLCVSFYPQSMERKKTCFIRNHAVLMFSRTIRNLLHSLMGLFSQVIIFQLDCCRLAKDAFELGTGRFSHARAHHSCAQSMDLH